MPRTARKQTFSTGSLFGSASARSLPQKSAEQCHPRAARPSHGILGQSKIFVHNHRDYNGATTRELSAVVKQDTDRVANCVPARHVYRPAGYNFSIGAPRNFSSRELERSAFGFTRILRFSHRRRILRASYVRASAFRSKVLNLAKTCSIGLRSGEYLGRNTRRAPTSRIARRMAFALWAPRLSRMTTSPGLRVGTRNCST
jgi:hypothetical protein